MTAHRWLAFGLIVVESLTLAVMTDARLYPAAASVAALVGAMGYLCRRVPLNTKAYTLAGGAAAFGLFWWQGLQGGTVPRAGDHGVMEALAMYLVFAQILDFFMEDTRPGSNAPPETAPGAGGRWRRADWFRVPWALPFSGVVVMACASHTGRGERPHHLFLALAAAFCVLFTLFYAMRPAGGQSRPAPARAAAARRRAWLPVTVAAILLAAASGLGVFASVVFQQNLYEVDRFFYEMISPRGGTASRGFSDQARLDSIRESKDGDADSAVLRVESARQPGYMRAYAYGTFDGREWTRPPMNVRLHAESKGAETRWHTYALRAGADSPTSGTMRVWPDASIGEVFPLPAGAVRLVTRAANVMRDETLAIAAASRDAGRLYLVGTGGVNEAWAEGEPTAGAAAGLTTTPATLDSRVRDLATSITRGCATAVERIAAVERHFVGGVYKFGIKIPRGEDPMSHFLLKSPPAHCEYYASGAAILLRLAGVPARYVTGFVVAERGLGGHWVARNRDAHAWVEAWNGTRWVIVECTPGEGIPGGRERSVFLSLADMAGFVAARVRELLGSIAFDWLAGALRWVAESMARTGVVALAVLAVLVAAAAAVRRARRRRQPGPAVSLPVRQLRVHLGKLDRHVARWGMVRRMDETLLRFADRLAAAPELEGPRREAAAAWYRSYAAVRYVPDPAPKEIAKLAAQADEVCRPVSRTQRN